MNLLEPSFALIKRHAADQHRTDTENELKLQNQLQQFWNRIGTLEDRVQRSEAAQKSLESRVQELAGDKASLESRLQMFEDKAASFEQRAQELGHINASLKSHLRKLGSDKEALEYRLQEIEKVASATEHRTLALETGKRPVGVTPYNPILESSCAGLAPIKLHGLMPSVFFLIEPDGSKVSDSSEFPLKMISVFRSIFKKMVDVATDKEGLETLREAFSTASALESTSKACLYLHHRRGKAHHNSIWTKEHPRSYACRACVNKQRLCMSIVENKVFVLPLHPLLRAGRNDSDRADTEMMDDSILDVVDADVCSTEVGYWVAAKARLTHHAPFNTAHADIWVVPTGGA